MAIVGARVLMLLENCPYPRDDRVRREAKTLIAAGYHVSVIAPSAPGEPGEAIVDGVHVLRFLAPSAARDFVGYLWEYAYSMAAMFLLSLRLLLSEGFDIVHAHHPPDTLALIGAFYKLLGKRYVLDHHDLAPELYYARFAGKGNVVVYRTLLALEKFACKVADHVIATNESYKAIEVQRDRVAEAEITIVRNGPDLEELRTIDCSPLSEMKERRTAIIGYVGVTGTQDGVDHLLRAIHCLTTDLGRTDFLCVVVGSGDALPWLESLSHQLGIENHMQFTGWVDGVPGVGRYLRSMDICVAPEPSDPYNDRSTASKIMDYMAFGKPTVASGLPEHRFTAQDCAIYARPDDERDFAEKIALLMDDPAKRERMGQKAKKRIESELGWAHQSQYLVDLYASLLPQWASN